MVLVKFPILSRAIRKQTVYKLVRKSIGEDVFDKVEEDVEQINYGPEEPA